MTPLSSQSIRAAHEALGRVPRGDLQVASLVVGEVLLAQAEQRSAAVSHALIDARMGSHGATSSTAESAGVRPLEVLRQGPKSDDERAAVSVLMAQHIGTLLDREGGSHTVRALLPGLDWLEFTGPYAPYSAARVALSQSALGRLEPLLRGTPVEAASEAAAAATRALRNGPLGSESTGTAEAPIAASPYRATSARASTALTVAGEVEGLTRSHLGRWLSILTGWSLLRGSVQLVARHVFSFRRPMTLTLDGELLRVVGHTEMLGRTLRTFDVRYPVPELVEIRREARYPALPAVLAATCLGLGALLGARAVIEGAGVQYFPLIGLGIGFILGGLVIEYLLRALFPGVQGMGRLIVRARDARGVSLSRIPLEEVDRLLETIDSRFGASGQTPRATGAAPEGAAASVGSAGTPEQPGGRGKAPPARRAARPSPERPA